MLADFPLLAEMRSRGVVFEDVDMGGGMHTVGGMLEYQGFKVAWFKDSEGNPRAERGAGLRLIDVQLDIGASVIAETSLAAA